MFTHAAWCYFVNCRPATISECKMLTTHVFSPVAVELRIDLLGHLAVRTCIMLPLHPPRVKIQNSAKMMVAEKCSFICAVRGHFPNLLLNLANNLVVQEFWACWEGLHISFM